jgi:hypothetical protein
MASLRAVVLAVVGVGAAAQGGVEPILDRVRAQFLWPAADAVPAVVAAARGFVSTLNASCLWPDINYFDQDRANWLAVTHLSRAYTIAQAATVPGSPAFDDPHLLNATACAVTTWLEGKTFPNTNPNWWYGFIGVPLQTSSIFAMQGLNRTSPAAAAAFIQESYKAAWWVNQWGGGANLIWMATVEIMRGAASGNMTALNEGFGAIWSNAVAGNVTSNWQGVVADNSYHFHGTLIMNSAYGVEWLSSLLSFWVVGAGTQWAMDPSRVALLARFIAEGNAQLSFGGRWDWGTQGRGIDRPGMDFSWGLPTPVIRALAAAPGAAPWTSQLLAFADAVDGAPAPGSLVGTKYFWTSDFLTHHRPGWGAALHMHGNNGVWTVETSECDNGECLLCEHTADGVLNLYASDGADAAPSAYAGIFPLLDWNAINGITVEHSTPVDVCGASNTWPTNFTKFVGGCADAGGSGVAAMDTATHATTVQRAWFFFDAAIVATASNLTNQAVDSGRPPADVWTTLVSRLLPQPAADPVTGPVAVGFANGTVVPALPDGDHSWPADAVAWVAAGGVGVWPGVPPAGVNPATGPLPSAPTLVLSVGNRSVPWDAIGPYPGTASGRLLTIALDHGAALPPPPAPGGATGAGYAYVLTANVTPAAMPALTASAAGAACVTATGAVHGAAAADGSVTAAVFWAPGGGSYSCAATGMALSSPGAGLFLVRRGAGGAVTVTASHPNRLGGALTVTVTGAVAGAGCAPGPAPGTTTFTVPLPTDGNYLGSPVNVTCA